MGASAKDIIPDESAPRPVIAELSLTSKWALTRWEGRSDDNRPVYIRYREYGLSVQLGDVGGHPDTALFAKPWFYADDVDIVDPWTISLETVCALTGIVIDCAVKQQA